MKPRALTDEEAYAAYQEYCQYLRAMFLWHPRKIAKRRGICIETLRRYIKEQRRKAA